MTDSTTTNSAGDPVAKAIAMLDLLTPEVREQVLSKMAPAMRERVQKRIDTTPVSNRPHGRFSNDIADNAAKRRLMREVAQGLQNQRVKAADDTAELLALASSDDRTALAANADYGHDEPASLPTATGSATGPAARRTASPQGAANPDDPLAQLANVHPAALARAMQGERAEAWAMVLDKLDHNVRTALETYLDANAREAIEKARVSQADLAPQLAMTIERAIARTVIPRAMREQRQIFSPTPYPQGA